MLNLTDSTFHDALTKPGFLLVDFFSVWCPPCKAMNPILDQIAKVYPGVTFAKFNTSENMVVPTDYKIANIPTFMLFKDGKLVQRDIGTKSAAAFGEWLEKGGVVK